MPKPAILTVDDDAEVLNALERDLRNHFKSAYRIIKASSGQEALDTVKELFKRSAPIALFLADQRMPGMSGTDFLKEAMVFYPDTCKVLLTAYADTEAAIESINKIGLDHYLMKPWDPPEVCLYPVLDDLLSKWSDKVRLPFEGIRVAGAKWSPQSYAIKEFLSRNQVPYQWIDIETDEKMKKIITEISGENFRLPVVFLQDGTSLISPGNNELAERIGLKTKAENPFYDLIIIGGGPAGLANAVYGASEGLKTILIEHKAPGGQAGTSSMIENYLGFPSGITGADLAQRAVSQAKRFGVEILTAQEVVGLERTDPFRTVVLSDGSKINGYAILISTGMEVKKLEVNGIDPLLGIGVYYGAAMTEAQTYKGKKICIIGGANSAGQGALFFARYASEVSMIIRASALEKGMSQYLINRIKETPNIQLIPDSEVVEVYGNGKLESLKIRNAEKGEERIYEADGMFIFIGAQPRSMMADGILERDERGFILTGMELPRTARGIKGWNLDRDPFLFETNIPGIFAAGDVRAGANRRVAAAVGDGSAAIYSIQKYLETV